MNRLTKKFLSDLILSLNSGFDIKPEVERDVWKKIYGVLETEFGDEDGASNFPANSLVEEPEALYNASSSPSIISYYSRTSSIGPTGNRGHLNSLQNYLDVSIPSLFDYGQYINDKSALDLLEVDQQEMLKNRLRLPSNKVDFGEYCRYAFLQIETMMQYYFSIMYDNISTYMKMRGSWRTNGNFQWRPVSPKNLDEVGVSEKLSCFVDDLIQDGISRQFAYGLNSRATLIKKVRNLISHRSIQLTQEEQNLLTLYNLELSRDVNFMSKSESDLIPDQIKLRKNIKPIVFRKDEDFKKVDQTLHDLIQNMDTLLSKSRNHKVV